MKPVIRALFAVGACCALFTLTAFAQDYRATLVGLVTDVNKAAIPGAKVKFAATSNIRSGCNSSCLGHQCWRLATSAA